MRNFKIFQTKVCLSTHNFSYISHSRTDQPRGFVDCGYSPYGVPENILEAMQILDIVRSLWVNEGKVNRPLIVKQLISSKYCTHSIKTHFWSFCKPEKLVSGWNIACVASVSVQFGSKELQGDFCSRPIFRAGKTLKTPFLRSLLHGNACYAG